MEKNGIIISHFGAIIKVLDARAYVSVFTGEKQEDNIKFNVPVYELLADKDFMREYEFYNVSGIIGTLNGLNIMITKERV